MTDATMQLLLLAAAPVATMVTATWVLRGYLIELRVLLKTQQTESTRIEADRKECEKNHEKELAATNGRVEDMRCDVGKLKNRLVKVETILKIGE